MSGYVNFNGSFMAHGSPLLSADSRAFRYGDGLFETMKFSGGEIQLAGLHFERLFHGMQVLGMETDTCWNQAFFEKEILETINKNGIAGTARLRLSLFRGEGGLYELNDRPGFIIQCWPLGIKKETGEEGIVVGMYKEVMKSCDILANIKSNNYLPYIMAAEHAKKNHWDDCIILNAHGRICDASTANVFWVKEGILFTPPLTEGCVAGVMRRNLLDILPREGFKIQQQEATIAVLENADELFLTNAIRGLRSVREFNGKIFANTICREITRRIAR